MTEWGVVTVIIALVTFGIAIIKPIVTLTNTIAKLTAAVDRLQADVEDQYTSSHESHRRLWEHNNEQDKQLSDHEGRIGRLESRS